MAGCAADGADAAPAGAAVKSREQLVEDLTILITDTVDPNSWSRAGGKPGTAQTRRLWPD